MFLWNVYCDHINMLFGTNGMGGFWLQGDQVKLICEHLNIEKDQIYYFSKMMVLIANKTREEDPEEDKE